VSWLVLLIATPLLTAAGYFSGLPWLLPLLEVLPAYPLMVGDLKRDKPCAALGKMMLWALLLAATVETMTVISPQAGESSVFHGTSYRDEMLSWIRTGSGKESIPARFLPEHALHLGAFVALSILSGSLLSLLLGAVLMNYMSFYVGSLLGIARDSHVILLAGWPPWAIARVAAFVTLGVLLAGPMLKRFGRVPFRWEGKRPWLLAAAAGIVLDVFLKTLLAPRWSELLRAALYPLSPGL